MTIRNSRIANAERRVVNAALKLHRRRHPENLYFDTATYELVKKLDDSCAALARRKRRV